MGEVVEVGRNFEAVPGITLCMACGDSFASLTPARAPVNQLECRTCGYQNSIFLAAATIRRALVELQEREQGNEG